MSWLRKTALVAGGLHLLTFVSSIPALFFLDPVLHDPHYIIGAGADTRVVFGCLLDMINPFAGVVTAVALFPVVRRQSHAHDAASLVVAGRSPVAVRDWTFLLGPGVMPAVNALLLGALMYRSRLVPRVLPIVGLIGAPLLLGSDVTTLFGVVDQTSGSASLLTLPIAVWEFTLGVWLVVKGFQPSPITAGLEGPGLSPARHATDD